MSRIYFWLSRALAPGVKTGSESLNIRQGAKVRGNQKYYIIILCGQGVLKFYINFSL